MLNFKLVRKGWTVINGLGREKLASMGENCPLIYPHTHKIEAKYLKDQKKNRNANLLNTCKIYRLKL